VTSIDITAQPCQQLQLVLQMLTRPQQMTPQVTTTRKTRMPFLRLKLRQKCSANVVNDWQHCNASAKARSEQGARQLNWLQRFKDSWISYLLSAT
jgi:hypothetical protein